MKSNLYHVAKLFLSQNNVFTYNDIAIKAGLSNKTIRNNLEATIKLLNKHNLTIERRPGIGIRIIGSKSDKLNCLKECNTFLQNQRHTSSKIRQMIIIFLLLNAKKKVTISSLEKQLYITRPSIYNDLKKVEDYFKDYDITISKDRKHGLVILAGEKRIRHCLLDLSSKIQMEDLSNYQICPEFIDFFTNIKSKDSQYTRIFTDFLLQVTEATDTTITAINLNRAVCFLNITFARIKAHNSVNLNLNTIDKILNIKFKMHIENHIRQLAKSLFVSLSDEEIIYISAKLSSYVTSNFKTLCKESQNPQLIFKIIDAYYKDLTQYLRIDDYIYLKNNLFILLEKNLQKLNFEYDFYNPDTKLIILKYPKLYHYASLLNDHIVDCFNFRLPSDALANMTLLLADIQEKRVTNVQILYYSKDLRFKQNLQINILKNNLPNVKITTTHKLTYPLDTAYDLILTASEQTPLDDERIIHVPQIMTVDFIQIMNDKIQEIRSHRRSDFFKI